MPRRHRRRHIDPLRRPSHRKTLLLAPPPTTGLHAPLRARETVRLGAHGLVVVSELALDDTALAVHGRRGEVQVPALRGVEPLRADLGTRAGLRRNRVLLGEGRPLVLDRDLLYLLLD